MYSSDTIRSLPGASGGRVLKMVTEMGSASIGGISPALSANAAKSFLEATDKEKKKMQGLNDRLGNYILAYFELNILHLFRR
ncbi:hypothetical protein WUBG_14646, partial [Wuchereria bancrofti]